MDRSERGPFSAYAGDLRAAGYSPLPILPGTKRPALRAWSEQCKAPLSPARIADMAKRMPEAGVGIALGFGGVCAVDVDTEVPAIADAIRAVLPEPRVIKIGARGWTAFYRAEGGTFIPSRRIPGMVEVLGSGTQTILPPSMHPQGLPYRWETGETLDRVPVGGLPAVPGDIAARLAAALAPWMAQPRQARMPPMSRRSPALLTDLERRRFIGFARAGLARQCASLTAQGLGGRNNALFALAAGLGRFVHHGILPAQELVEAAIAACRRNGLLQEEGRPALIAIIKNGLRFAANDELPELADRPCSGGAAA